MDHNPAFIWYEDLIAKPWYRGTDIQGRSPMNNLFMGEGFYLSWDAGTAYTYAILAAVKHHHGAVLKKYKLKPDLVFLDIDSKRMKKIQNEIQNQAFGNINLYIKPLIISLKNSGYNGIISSKRSFGLLLFDPETATFIEEDFIGFFDTPPSDISSSLEFPIN